MRKHGMGSALARQSVKAKSRDEIVRQFYAIGRRGTFCGLLAVALRRSWKPGWAAFAFKEIFGDWPRDRDRGSAVEIEDSLVEQWIELRPKRKKVARPAPLVEAAEQAPVVIGDGGFVEGTLMKPEDYEVKW
jgi:hypothetical protein